MKISEMLLEKFMEAHQLDGLDASLNASGVARISMLKNGEILHPADQRRLLKKMVGFPYPNAQAAIVHQLQASNPMKINKSEYEWGYPAAREVAWHDTFISTQSNGAISLEF